MDLPSTQSDLAGLDGRLLIYRRPADMKLAHFLMQGAGELDLEVHNTVLNQYWVDLLATINGTTNPAPPSLLIAGLSLGTGAASPARTDTHLVTEWKRHLVIATTATSADPPSTTLSFYSPASDGAVTLTEAGLLYAGATTTLGTGKVMSHASFSYAKPNNQDVRIDYQLSRSTAS